jgi:hypothetical protein
MVWRTSLQKTPGRGILVVVNRDLPTQEPC